MWIVNKKKKNSENTNTNFALSSNKIILQKDFLLIFSPSSIHPLLLAQIFSSVDTSFIVVQNLFWHRKEYLSLEIIFNSSICHSKDIFLQRHITEMNLFCDDTSLREKFLHRHFAQENHFPQRNTTYH